MRQLRLWWLVTAACLLRTPAHCSGKYAGTAQLADDALDNYVRQVINNFFASLATGIPELGLPPLDPLLIGNITVPHMTLPGGYVDAAVAGATVHELSKLTVTSLHIDLDHLHMEMRAFLPYLTTDGSYSLDGLFMKVFPLYGDGPFKIELFDLTMMGAGSIAVDDTRHLQLTSLAMDLDFTTIIVDFENIMGGGDFGDTINGILTNLGKTIIDQVKPTIIGYLTNGIITVVNDALSKLGPI